MLILTNTRNFGENIDTTGNYFKICLTPRLFGTSRLSGTRENQSRESKGGEAVRKAIRKAVRNAVREVGCEAVRILQWRHYSM